MSGPDIEHRAKPLRYGRRVGGGEFGLFAVSSIMVFNRAKQARLETGGIEDRADEIGGRSLSVGACDAYRFEPVTGRVMQGMAELGVGGSDVGNNTLRNRNLGPGMVAENRNRAAINGLFDKVGPIHGRAWDRGEKCVGAAVFAVVGGGGDRNVGTAYKTSGREECL